MLPKFIRSHAEQKAKFQQAVQIKHQIKTTSLTFHMLLHAPSTMTAYSEANKISERKKKKIKELFKSKLSQQKINEVYTNTTKRNNNNYLFA